MKPFISLCMIVKNEEKVIERCLSSVVDLVDELIIVDTGSIDNTKEISKKYTSKIFDFDWIDDFSAARNYAASKASGEWILVLDADEYLDKQNFNDFLNQLKLDNGDYPAYAVKIINFSGKNGEIITQNYHHRLYKNNNEIIYYRKIHEQLQNKNGIQLNVMKSNLIVYHSGYLKNTMVEKNKSVRNKQLLDAELKKGNNSAFDYFNYGNEYYSIGDYEKALHFYFKAYKLKNDYDLSWIPIALYQIITCLMNLNRKNDALNIIKDAENIYGSTPEFLYLKGEIYFQRRQFDDAKTIFQNIINSTEKYKHIILRPDFKNEKPHLRLGEIYFYEEDYNNAIIHYISVLNINKSHYESISRIIYILNKFHSEDEISNFLNTNKLISSNNLKSYIKACFDIGNSFLALHILNDYSEDNVALYKISLLKNLCINNEGDILGFLDILDFEVLKKLVETNWINIIDLVSLKSYKNKNDDLSKMLDLFLENKQIKELVDLLDSSVGTIENIEETLLLSSLQILITYKKYNICSQLLKNIDSTKESFMIKVARILFRNNFKAEALSIYDNCSWNTFEEVDLLNIIRSLDVTGNSDEALKVAKFAILNFQEDFRFYKYILENTDNSALIHPTINQAKKIFLGSKYLDRFAF